MTCARACSLSSLAGSRSHSLVSRAIGIRFPRFQWKRFSKVLIGTSDEEAETRSAGAFGRKQKNGSLAVCVAQARAGHSGRENMVLLHFVEQGFVADLELDRRHLAVPLGGNQHPLDDPGLSPFLQALHH